MPEARKDFYFERVLLCFKALGPFRRFLKLFCLVFRQTERLFRVGRSACPARQGIRRHVPAIPLVKNNTLYQFSPLLRITCQKLLMPQLLLMNDRMGKMPLIAGAVLFSHFQRVKNVNLRARHIKLVRQRCDKIGIKLIFTAPLCHVLPCAAEHCHECFSVTAHLRRPFFQLLLQKPAFESAVPNKRIDHRHKKIGLQLRERLGGLIQIGTAQNAASI